MKSLAIFLTSLIIVIMTLVWQGFVLMVLWNWFISGIVNYKVNLPLAIGIKLVYDLISFDPSKSTDRSKDFTRDFEKILYRLISPLVILIISFIVYMFI